MYLDMDDLPYFMNNDEWYYYDSKEEIFKPTAKAPERAIQSIIDFNNECTCIDENGNVWKID